MVTVSVAVAADAMNRGFVSDIEATGNKFVVCTRGEKILCISIYCILLLLLLLLFPVTTAT